MRQIFALLILFGCVSLLQAQTTPEVWRLLDGGIATIRIPPDWLPEVELNLTAAVDPVSGARLKLEVSSVPDGTTLDTVLQNAIQQTALPILVDREALPLPAGGAQRLETRGEFAGQQARQVQYFVIVQNTLITVTGAALLDNEAAVTIFDRAVNTLQIFIPRDTAWLGYTSFEGQVFAQAPLNWEQVAAPDNTLSVVQRATSTVVTITTRRLVQADPLETVVQDIQRIYRDSGIIVAEAVPVYLPMGRAYRLILLNLPSQNFRGEAITVQQYQYLVVRDDVLLLVNAGTEVANFDDTAATLERVVDTIVWR